MSGDGTRLAIGAPYNDGKGFESGHVRVYEYDVNNVNRWTQLGSDIDGEAAFDESGYSVSLSADGTTVAIGAPFNDANGSNSGHVQIFTFEEASESPSVDPSESPSTLPSVEPSVSPSTLPSVEPSESPSTSAGPSTLPSVDPSESPSFAPKTKSNKRPKATKKGRVRRTRAPKRKGKVKRHLFA